MSAENAKLELYLLFCQCASVLLISIMNAAEKSSPHIKTVIEEKIFQLTETLLLYLRAPPLRSERKLVASRSLQDISADLHSSGQSGHSAYHSARSTLPGLVQSSVSIGGCINFSIIIQNHPFNRLPHIEKPLSDQIFELDRAIWA